MDGIRVFVVDDNVELRKILCEFLARQEDITLVGQAGTGNEALAFLADHAVDVMLLDLIMPQLDGYGVLEQLQRAGADAPQVIALTALGRDDFIQRAIALGVRYYLVKPVEMRLLLDRIREVAGRGQSASPQLRAVPPLATPGHSMDERLASLFLTLGIPAHIKGYHFLREGIKMVIERPELINSITKELYPGIGRRFNTTASKVERAIRHAIEVAWSRGRIETLNKAFGCRVATPEDKPTNGEFIAMIADKLSMERTA